MTGPKTRMPPKSEETVWLDDAEGVDPRRVGRKAQRLAELRGAGVATPPGVALDVSSCDSVLRIDDEEEARGTVSAVVGPALGRLGEGPYAVRSSGVDEDGRYESMAGLFHTELDVEASGVPGAVLRCLRKSRAAARDRGDEAPALAILIQPMVRARAAGVAFSRDPVTGDDRVVISAVEGLADRLVAGEVTGDDWVVEDGEPRPRAADRTVLDAAEVREIAEEALRIEERFGAPQDVEWAWGEDGLRIVQARPITALPVPPPDEPVPDGTWIKDVTHYPRGLTPLDASVFSPAIERGIEHGFGRWGLLIERVEQRLIRHEAYMRPVPVGGKDGPPPPALLMGILARVIPALRDRIRTARRAMDEDLGSRVVDAWQTRDRPRLEETFRTLLETDLPALSDDELIAHFDACVELLEEGERIHFVLFVPYVTALYDLARFLEAELGWDTPRVLELVAGLSSETSGPSRALAELGREVAASEVASAVIEAPDIADADVADALEADAPEVARAWRAFVDRWAHRTTGYGPGEPTLAERPGVIRRRVAELAEGAEARWDELRRRREAVEEEALDALEPDRRDQFRDLLATARERWPVREENVAYTDSMPSAVVRYAALEMGRRLVERGQLGEREDAVMFGRDELVAALREGTELSDTARRRHAERAWVAAHPGPPILNGPDHDPPDLKYMPEAVRRTSGALIWTMDFEYSVADETTGDALAGQPGAPGKVRGTARIVSGPEDFHRVRSGDVMVCPTTTPAWTVLFSTLAGIVAEGGGVLAHSAIAAREHHIPAVLGVTDARERIEDGALIEVDGTNGVVRVLG